MPQFSSQSTTSYGGRMMQSLGRAVFGAIIFIVAIPLLFWNEGRAVGDAKRLDEGSKSVVSISSDKVDPANEGKEVCLGGPAVAAGVLEDPAFDIKVNALALGRNVEMYQWKQTSHEEKKTGGSSVTTYDYDKTWSATKINSAGFHDHKTSRGERMDNPDDWKFDKKTWHPAVVTVGAFKLSDDLIGQIAPQDPLPPAGGSTTAPTTAESAGVAPSTTESDDTTQPTAASHGYTVDGDRYFVGEDPKNPEVGDMRVTFKITRPQPLTVVAQQSGSTFVPYPAKAGGTISMLRLGRHTATEMFEMAKADANRLTWILRIIGFIMLAAGIGMALKPLTLLVGFLPFLESFADMATGLVAVLGAVVVWLLTVSIAWLVYRPLIGVLMLAVAGGALFLLIKSRRKMPRSAVKPGVA